MSQTIRQIASSDSYPELVEAVEERVVDAFRRKLMMEDGEAFDAEANFFDLGLSSLRLTEIRQELQDLLGLDVDATAMFNQPTVRDLVAHLANQVHRDVAVPGRTS